MKARGQAGGGHLKDEMEVGRIVEGVSGLVGVSGLGKSLCILHTHS